MLFSASGAPEFMPMNKEKKIITISGLEILKSNTESTENGASSLTVFYKLRLLGNPVFWPGDGMDCP